MSGLSTRKRTIPFNYGGSTTTTIFPPFGSGVPSVVRSNLVALCHQVTTSTDTAYPGYLRYKKSAAKRGFSVPRIDLGSDFYTAYSRVEGGSQMTFTRTGIVPGSSLSVADALWVPQSVSMSPPVLLPSISGTELSNLYAYGATAISRCQPLKPISSVSNFLGELYRDGIPSFPGVELSPLKGLKRLPTKGSKEYLNLEFAIKPFVSDIRKFLVAAKKSDKLIRQLQAASGKGIRRKYVFPDEVTTVINAPFSSKPSGAADASWFTSGTVQSTTVTTVRRWFSGEFCYFFNINNSVQGRISRSISIANKLYGVRITPEVLWNLLPWSWALDWIANIGDVIANISAFSNDGLVMRYGYIMEHKTIVTTYTLSGYGLSARVSGSTTPITVRSVQERKVRLKASPYGFGVLDASLSARQLAIIAALGITRSGRYAK